MFLGASRIPPPPLFDSGARGEIGQMGDANELEESVYLHHLHQHGRIMSYEVMALTMGA